MKLPRIKNIKGFTLIELLVVIGILAILLSIVLIAINPARQFGQANNTRRRSDVTQVLNAIGAYAADHKGVLPPPLITQNATMSASKAVVTVTPVPAGGWPATAADVCQYLVPNYIPALPQDPQVEGGTSITDCTAYTTGYNIYVDSNNRVTVMAPLAENGETIMNTR
jgi:prepilin-type N-terminal cleavage/methylation domain-containing protein